MSRDLKYELIAKFLTNSISDKEKEILEAWLNESKEYRREFEKLQTWWNQSNDAFKGFNPDTSKAWEYVKQRTVTRESKPVWLNSYWRIAASIALILALSLGIYEYINYRHFNGPGIALYQSLDSIREVTLPDHSKIWLNRNTTLKLHRHFGENGKRQVMLKGEAFFDIDRDTLRPFTIKARSTMVKVLGTAFLVDAEKKNDFVSVIVKRGRVAFYKRKNNRVELTPGKKAVLKNGEMKAMVTNNTDPNYLSWKTNELIFNNTPLAEVVATLSKHYGITIENHVTDPQNYELKASFKSESLEDILSMIEYTLDLKFVKKDGKYELYKK